MMSDRGEPFDPEKTISSSSAEGVVNNYAQLRDEFSILTCEDGSVYRDMKLLGMGGVGVVYCAEDPTLERQVAVKILREPFRNDRSQITKFINEARITAKIDHPNIVAVHQLGVNEQNGIYFSMRKISGETLQNAIKRLSDGDPEALRHYTRRRLIDIFIAGCNGVAAAHDKKLLHCDLKPANIMIGSFGEVLVLDWGLAKEFECSENSGQMISGTPGFMAPELIRGVAKKHDEKTEVYALGTILYSILTWKPAPFDLTLKKEVLFSKIANGKCISLRAPKGHILNGELAAICRKAMHHNRDKRYATVKELLDDLHNFRDGYPVAAYSPNVIYRLFKLCRRRPLIPIAVCAALLTVMIYKISEDVLELAHDRSLLRSAEINYRIAEDYYRRTLAKQKQLFAPDIDRSPVQLAMDEKKTLMRANLAVMEYFSILDSAAGLSEHGKHIFAAQYGPQIFYKLLRLNVELGNKEELSRILARCRRSDIFERSCESDSMLGELVRRIESGVGQVQMHFGGNKDKIDAVVIHPDKTVENLTVSRDVMFELPAGHNDLHLENGVNMHLEIVPGGVVYISCPPEHKRPGGALIPADHFFITVKDVGTFRCDLESFQVSRESVGKYTMEEFMEKFPDSRLPSIYELRKILRVGRDGKSSFYGIEFPAGYVLLKSGRFYDPDSDRVVNHVPGNAGYVYLISGVE